MTKLKSPLFSFSAKRSLGDDIVFQRRGRENLAGARQSHPDAKSAGQLSWRTMFQKVVSLWNALSPSEKLAWEQKARRKHMTGYAWFVSQALRPNPGIYLPLQGGTMAGDIYMATKRILDLPDPIVDQEPATKAWVLANMPAGGYTDGARVTHSVNQSIPNSSWTALAFDTDVFDTDQIHDPVTNNSHLTCKTAGKYLIIGQATWATQAGGRRLAGIFHDTDGYIGWDESSLSVINSTSLNLSTVYELALNDFLQFKVFQNSGTPININASAIFTPVFSMQRIG